MVGQNIRQTAYGKPYQLKKKLTPITWDWPCESLFSNEFSSRTSNCIHAYALQNQKSQGKQVVKLPTAGQTSLSATMISKQLPFKTETIPVK